MSLPIPDEKSEWPELVGWLATLAATSIAYDRPDVFVEVLPPGSRITLDYNPKRVRLLIDDSGIVCQTPFIG